MDKKEQLFEQIKIVINKLEKEYGNELDDGILKLIYIRYKNALEILENDTDINEINITGGVRAYMDSYSDYQNPLLGEMHKAEKCIKNYCKKCLSFLELCSNVNIIFLLKVIRWVSC